MFNLLFIAKLLFCLDDLWFNLLQFQFGLFKLLFNLFMLFLEMFNLLWELFNVSFDSLLSVMLFRVFLKCFELLGACALLIVSLLISMLLIWLVVLSVVKTTTFFLSLTLLKICFFNCCETFLLRCEVRREWSVTGCCKYVTTGTVKQETYKNIYCKLS